MIKLLTTVALVIGMITATFANEKEVNITVDDDKLHFNYYSATTYEGIIVDPASQLTLVTEKGIEVTLTPDMKIESQKGFTSESITVSFELSACEAELLSRTRVVEAKLKHANGVQEHTIEEEVTPENEV